MWQQSNVIVVYEPDHCIGELIVDVLTDAGYVVCAVRCVTEMLTYVTRDCAALLLLDVWELDLESAARVAHHHTRMPIVGMTTSTAPAPLQGVLECTMWLVKPFDIAALLDCVARCVPSPEPPTA